MRRQVVSICPSPDGRQCAPGRDWTQGWIMFNNRDRDEPPAIDNGEPVLQVHRTGDNLRITANRRGFTLRSTAKRATNGTIVVCDAASRVEPKALVVSYTGRPRVAVASGTRAVHARTRLQARAGLQGHRLRKGEGEGEGQSRPGKTLMSAGSAEMEEALTRMGAPRSSNISRPDRPT